MREVVRGQHLAAPSHVRQRHQLLTRRRLDVRAVRTLIARACVLQEAYARQLDEAAARVRSDLLRHGVEADNGGAAAGQVLEAGGKEARAPALAAVRGGHAKEADPAGAVRVSERHDAADRLVGRGLGG